MRQFLLSRLECGKRAFFFHAPYLGKLECDEDLPINELKFVKTHPCGSLLPLLLLNIYSLLYELVFDGDLWPFPPQDPWIGLEPAVSIDETLHDTWTDGNPADLETWIEEGFLHEEFLFMNEVGIPSLWHSRQIGHKRARQLSVWHLIYIVKH